MDPEDPYRDERAGPPVVVLRAGAVTITRDGCGVTAGTSVTGTNGGGTWNGETIRVVGNFGEGNGATLAESTARQ